MWASVLFMQALKVALSRLVHDLLVLNVASKTELEAFLSLFGSRLRPLTLKIDPFSSIISILLVPTLRHTSPSPRHIRSTALCDPSNHLRSFPGALFKEHWHIFYLPSLTDFHGCSVRDSLITFQLHMFKLSLKLRALYSCLTLSCALLIENAWPV
ncbi:hypothetical protein F4677DRAFT_127074 [Hypoxylon crocopeplum]|nr:hypothetical protein F4677DRAFT_127074 [Hypoxylon crocopeplum]